MSCASGNKRVHWPARGNPLSIFCWDSPLFFIWMQYLRRQPWSASGPFQGSSGRLLCHGESVNLLHLSFSCESERHADRVFLLAQTLFLVEQKGQSLAPSLVRPCPPWRRLVVSLRFHWRSGAGDGHAWTQSLGCLEQLKSSVSHPIKCLANRI